MRQGFVGLALCGRERFVSQACFAAELWGAERREGNAWVFCLLAPSDVRPTQDIANAGEFCAVLTHLLAAMRALTDPRAKGSKHKDGLGKACSGATHSPAAELEHEVHQEMLQYWHPAWSLLPWSWHWIQVTSEQFLEGTKWSLPCTPWQHFAELSVTEEQKLDAGNCLVLPSTYCSQTGILGGCLHSAMRIMEIIADLLSSESSEPNGFHLNMRQICLCTV